MRIADGITETDFSGQVTMMFNKINKNEHSQVALPVHGTCFV